MSGIDNVDDYLYHILDKINPDIKLDEEQRAAVVSDADRALVVAGAGTGKTTTIVAKIKYLVDVLGVAPEKILVMSYTRKAVQELQHRINVDLEIPATIMTFHSLGLKYTRLLNDDKKVSPIDSNERSSFFLDYLKERVFPNQEKIEELITIFNDEQISWIDPRAHTYGPFFLNNFHNYSSFDEYFDAYVEKKLSETKDIVRRVNDIADQKINSERPTTIRGERVKSKGEAIIANYLLCNGIDYAYERVYDELVGDHQTYHPDFTVDIGGEKIYIEYFGMSGSDFDNASYNHIREEKERRHRERHNKFIALDYQPNRGYLRTLYAELLKLGARPKPMPIEEIYNIILRQNPLAEFYHLESFIYSVIDLIKSSEKIDSFDDYKKLCESIIDSESNELVKDVKRAQIRWIEEYWDYYNQKRANDSSKLLVDYADMIKDPQGRLHEIIPEKISFDYVIVDEYQDISAARFKLLKETLDCSGAKFFAIGDDWQSIYSFQGSKIGYILNFDDHFPGAQRFMISKTYRNAQLLIDAAGTFVMRNASQIKKSLRSNKDINRPIVFAKIKKPLFGKKTSVEARNDMVEEIVREIHRNHPEDSICILSRTNRMLDTLFESQAFINSAENKVKLRDISNFYFDAMTIHKSKGLTYDWTIVMPLTSMFPHDPKNVIWLFDIIRNDPEEESLPYAEQRRLFYVALTRTKNRVYILFPEGEKHSKYKDELYDIIAGLNVLREQSANN